MPSFTEWTEVEAEVNVSVDEFISECSDKEITELIQALRNEGYFTEMYGDESESPLLSALATLAANQMLLSAEQEESIISLAKSIWIR